MTTTTQEKKKKITKKKVKRSVSVGIAHVKCTFNNTIITISDMEGHSVVWASGGTIGYKGSRKSTPYAAQQVATKAAELAIEQGLKQIEVFIKGPGAGRESAIRALQASGLEIKAIKDVTPIPHNGCRPPKRRRV
jgi:small subunit ribosomal protein S11